jgi:hypothetical protein
MKARSRIGGLRMEIRHRGDEGVRFVGKSWFAVLGGVGRIVMMESVGGIE